MNIKKLAAMVLAVVMAVSLVGCSGGEKPAVVATFDGGEIPAGVYIYYQMTAASNAYMQLNNPYLAFESLFSQKIDGISADKWINEKTADMVKIHAATESEITRLGLALSEEQTAEIQTQLDAAWGSDGASFEKIGVTREALESVMKMDYLSQSLFNAYYGEDGSEPVPEQELRDFFDDNYRRCIMLVMSFLDPTNGQPLSIDQSNAVKNAYAQYKASLEQGASMGEILTKEQHRIYDTFNITGAPVDIVEEDYESLVYKNSDAYPQGLLDMIFADDAPLDTPMFYEDDAFLVPFEIRETFREGQSFDEVKEAMLSAYKYDEFIAKIEGLTGSINFVLDENAAKAYPARNLAMS